MKRTTLAVLAAVCVAAAFTMAREERPAAADKPSPPNLGVLCLLPASEIQNHLITSDQAAMIFLNGNFVGNYASLHSPGTRFRLPSGKHKVRVEIPGFKAYESEVFLVGNETEQSLLLTMTKL